MKKQPKSITVAAQPSLFHLWNVSKDTPDTNTSSNDKNTDVSAPTKAVAASNLDEGTSRAKRRSRTVTKTLAEPSKRSRKGKSGNGSLLEKAEVSLERNENEEPIGDIMDGPAMSSGDGHSDKVSGGSLPSRGDTQGSFKGKEKERNQLNHSKLFPIFGQKSGPGSSPTPASKEGTKPKRRKGKLVKSDVNSMNARPFRRTNSTPSKSSEGFSDAGVSVGPSSQPPPSSPINLLSENADEDSMEEGPSYVTGESQDQPIVIESSPVREQPSMSYAAIPLKLKRHSKEQTSTEFFAKRKLGPTTTIPKVRNHVGEGNNPKWPDKDDQHVRGAQTSFLVSPLGFTQGRKMMHFEPSVGGPSTTPAPSDTCPYINKTPQPSFDPKYLIEPIGAQSDGHARCESTLQSNASCPAIARFLSADYDISGSSWNERWRPRCASEVLGNEESSKYLRDWLVAQEIRTGNQAQGTDMTIKDGSSGVNTAGKPSRGLKRPQVIRSVVKPRKRRKRVDSDDESLDDWVADEDEDDLEMSPISEDDSEDELLDDAEGGSPWKPKLTRLFRKRPPDSSNSCIQREESPSQHPPHDFSGRLTNAILLSGPSGSGKTAAIYACAEELGWEVFEVYPGIGRRNGANLLSLVGDVGKNHIVNRGARSIVTTIEREDSLKGDLAEGRRKAVPQAFSSFFGTVNKAPSRTISENHSLELNGESPGPSTKVNRQSSLDPFIGDERASTPLHNHNLDSKRAATKQSIILLEEVDILYSEDLHFWSTVITLIRESRRPVIMTCNDPSLVPSGNLPLQATLTFSSCLSELATSYLECLALTEGYAASRDHIKSLYEDDNSSDEYDTSDGLVRSSVLAPCVPDLRRAINSLQFLCQGSAGFNSPTSPVSPCIEASPNVTAEAVNAEWDDVDSFDWNRLLSSECVLLDNGPDIRRREAKHIDNLSRISDAISMIDSNLSRGPHSILNMQLECGSPSDNEIGHRRLELEDNILHLQDGIVLYNHDEAISTEAIRGAKKAIEGYASEFGTGSISPIRTVARGKLSNEILRNRSQHFSRVSGILERIVPIAAVSKESVGALILDYEPWVRSIDRSDALLELASIKDVETRLIGGGGRSTRNSQRVQYSRYFNLDEEEREALQSGALSDRVPDTLCGDERTVERAHLDL